MSIERATFACCCASPPLVTLIADLLAMLVYYCKNLWLGGWPSWNEPFCEFVVARRCTLLSRLWCWGLRLVLLNALVAYRRCGFVSWDAPPWLLKSRVRCALLFILRKLFYFTYLCCEFLEFAWSSNCGGVSVVYCWCYSPWLLDDEFIFGLWALYMTPLSLSWSNSCVAGISSMLFLLKNVSFEA